MNRQKIESSIWGFILGDCWGVPYEFKRSEQIKFKEFDGYGTWNKPPGTWSDDTSMMLCLMDSFDGTAFDIEKHKQNLKDWINKDKFTIDGCFDVGNATLKAIESDFTNDTGKQHGNGGLLRTWIALILFEGIVKNFRELLSITHSDSGNYLIVLDYYWLLYHCLISSENFGNIEDAKVFFRDQKTDISNLGISLLEKPGTVQNAVKIAIDAIYNNYTLKEVIEQGGDTDSNAAIYGSLYYIKNDFPDEYKKQIRSYEYLQEQINKFLDLYFGIK
jgi:ADP-ribosylglycohydrolase